MVSRNPHGFVASLLWILLSTIGYLLLLSPDHCIAFTTTTTPNIFCRACTAPSCSERHGRSWSAVPSIARISATKKKAAVLLPFPSSVRTTSSSFFFELKSSTSDETEVTTTGSDELASPDLATTTTTSLTAEQEAELDDKAELITRTILLLGGQSLLIVVAVVLALVASIPNYGLGPNFVLDPMSAVLGVVWTLPLLVMALLLEQIEDKVPGVQDVSNATEQSVLALLGEEFRPMLAVGIATAFGIAAGLGEEMLFRGVIQFGLSDRIGNPLAAMGLTSLLFGLGHAVTPWYFGLTTAASFFFGWLYQSSGNLAVPIVTHAVYDIGALLFAHWQVTEQMSPEERQAIKDWEPPQK